jgi:hypothetical protein
MTNFSWFDTFSNFEDSSNENDAISDVVSKLLDNDTQDLSNWLDIGSGDLKKLVTVVRKLLNTYSLKEYQLSSIEPDAEKLDLRNSSEYADIVSLVGRFELTNAPFSANKFLSAIRKADIVSAIHVLYDSELVEEFTMLLEEMKPRSGLIVICEASNSDFSRIRKTLREGNLSTPNSHLRLIKNYCDAHPSRYISETFQIKGQYCHIEAAALRVGDDNWFFPFIMGETHDVFRKRNVADKRYISDIVVDYVEKKGPTLSVNDECLHIKILP